MHAKDRGGSALSARWDVGSGRRVVVVLALLTLLAAGLVGGARPVEAAPVLALPDLISVIPTSQMGVVHPTPTTKEFDYTHIVYNAGAGPLEVQPTAYDTTTQLATGVQRVYAWDGSTKSLGQTATTHDQFYFHTLHGHFHFPLASFGLFSVKPDGSVGDPVALSPKNGFCIGDSVQLDPTLPHTQPWIQYAGDTCVNPTAVRGISPGWGDLYNREDPGQSIDITNLPDGVYWFHSVADPGHNFLESDTTNNTTDVKLRITGDTVTPLSPLVSQGNFVIDQSFLDDGVGPADTPAFSTAYPDDLLVAYVAADGVGSTPQTATVTGGGLTWSLAQRTNTRRGTAEVWTARANGLLTNATIRSTTSSPNVAQSLTVFAIAGASGLGAKASANGANGPPTAALTTTRPGSWVMAVGNDPDHGSQRVPAPGQTMVHQTWNAGTQWMQAKAAPTPASGTAVTMRDDYPAGDAWNLSAVEILAADSNDTTAPAISAAHTTRVGPDSATVAWTTDEPSTSQVAYGPTEELGQTTPVDTTLVTDHARDLTGLTPDTSYFCQLRSTDSSGNTGVAAGFTFTTTAPRTTPPAFSDIRVSDLQPDQATFAWTTDEPADSQVQFGTTTSYGSASSRDPNPTTAHFTVVNGLTPATTYHYRVVGTDAYGNAGTGPDATFTTPAVAPPITLDTTVARDAKGAATTPLFSTSAPGELLVAFVAADGPGGGGQTATVTGAGLTWSLARRANGRPGTSEVWTATAANALTNATVTSTTSAGGFDQALTVAAFHGAVGIGASAAASAASGAPSVSFSTTRVGSFAYAVGNDWDRATARTLGPGQAMTHQWVDTSLGDTFWTQARTTDTGPVESVVTLNDTAPTADQYNFVGVEIVRPLSVTPPPVDTTPPVITAFAAGGTTQTSTTISWTTNEPSSTRVEYGTTTGYGTATTLDATLRTSHSVVLSGLAPATGYHARALSTDAAGNAATSTDVTFTTVTPPPPDTTPPVITAFATSNVTTTAATFTWTTDEPSTTQVDLGTTTNYGSTSPLVTTLTTSHTVTLANLVAAITYHVRARSTDAAGNLATSADATFTTTTPPPPSALAIDASTTRTGRGTVTTAAVTTTAPTLLLAFVGADGPSGNQTATVTGSGLTWTLVRRTNARPGTAEVWRATVPAARANLTVTAALARPAFDAALTVVAFRGASGVGASNGANAASGAPTVSLTTTRAGAWVFGVGNDWDRAVARTLGTGQTMVSQWVDTAVGDTFWVQSRTAVTPAIGSVTLNDTAPTNDRWNLTAVEVLPAT